MLLLFFFTANLYFCCYFHNYLSFDGLTRFASASLSNGRLYQKQLSLVARCLPG